MEVKGKGWNVGERTTDEEDEAASDDGDGKSGRFYEFHDCENQWKKNSTSLVSIDDDIIRYRVSRNK